MANASATLTLGGVSAPLLSPSRPERVPHTTAFGGAALDTLPQELLLHLRWMLQKDLAGQDMCLLGPPGPLRRRLAQLYCELRGHEAEYVCLSRDTTESDLKQRREIVGGSVRYVDQPPVQAAVHGRVLILDGLERAERNVLPSLNNLLENREMALEDGRMLISPQRYDSMGGGGGAGRGLVRVSPRFRVIALGLPVPPFIGRPLDPPLRSRFQARSVGAANLDTLRALARLDGVGAPDSALDPLLGFVGTLRALERDSRAQRARGTARGLPHLSDAAVAFAARAVAVLDSPQAVAAMLGRVLPLRVMAAGDAEAAEAHERAVAGAAQHFMQLRDALAAEKASWLGAGPRVSPHSMLGAQPAASGVSLQLTGIAGEGRLLAQGHASAGQPTRSGGPELMPEQMGTLSAMLVDHALGRDLCLVGPSGCGKTRVVRQFCAALGYGPELVEQINLYQDMTTRELLQRRGTDDDGDTNWESTGLVSAAVRGGVLVLDGVHRAARGVLEVLQPLFHDREIELGSGARLLSHTQYDQLQRALGASDAKMASISCFRIHPAFRVVAVGELPRSRNGWVTEELIAAFNVHTMQPLPSEQLEVMLRASSPAVHPGALRSLVAFAAELRRSESALGEAGTAYALPSISLRQLSRAARRVQSAGLAAHLSNAMLLPFIPRLVADQVRQLLGRCGIEAVEGGSAEKLRIESSPTELRIGDVSARVTAPANPELVPQTQFFAIAMHIRILREMLRDLELLSERALLLIGNQGVGKNKITDKLLMLLHREREYVQLHRDTTVQSLTVAPSLTDGVISWEDSPLVRAVRLGRVLVVDEADKAPAEVVAVLKSLGEDGALVLSDGKRIVPTGYLQRRGAPHPLVAEGEYIEMHPQFRMIVLANRPGYPFLGNDFFRECGDVFAVHVIPNPDLQSELELLRAYAPAVAESTLNRIALAFQELRSLHESGSLSYPYSTREIVAVVKHLQLFPDDGLATTLGNVLDFDEYDEETTATLRQVLHRHGIPFGVGADAQEQLATATPLAAPELAERWRWNRSAAPSQQTAGASSPYSETVTNLPSVLGNVFGVVAGRTGSFTEELLCWTVPCDGRSALSVAAAADGAVHVLVEFPTLALHSFDQAAKTCSVTQLEPEAYPGMTSQAFSASRAALDTDCKVIAPLLRSNRVACYQPNAARLLIVDPHNVSESVALSNIAGVCPDATSGATAAWAGLLRRRGANQPVTSTFRLVQSAALAAVDTLLFFRKGGSEIVWVDTESRTSNSFVLKITQKSAAGVGMPAVLGGVSTLTAGTWLCTDESQQVLGFVSGCLAGQPIYTPVDVADRSALPATLSAANALADAPSTLLATMDAGAAAMSAKGLRGATAAGPGSADVHRHSYDLAEETAAVLAAGCLATGLGWRSLRLHSGQAVLEICDHGAGTVRRLVLEHSEDQDVGGAVARATDKVAAARMRFKAAREGGLAETAAAAGSQQVQVVQVAETAGGQVVALQADGIVRLLQLDEAVLRSELEEWEIMLGRRRADSSSRKHGAVAEPDNGKRADAKEGKEDGEKHVGGNTWKGGLGGSQTAGLGGVGGPWRVSKAAQGDRVHQIDEATKAGLSEEARQAARKLGLEALEQKLKEIGMSTEDDEAYEGIAGGVAAEVAQLRRVLEAAESRQRERAWQRWQLDGDLDDSRLVDGVAGERRVYRRRVESEPEPGAAQQLPKRLRFLVDISGSMYRFNAEDRRLDRCIEATAMIMEGLDGMSGKWDYSVAGHSGDHACIPLKEWGGKAPDKTEKLQLLRSMQAHAQYCASGDNTLPAMVDGAKSAAQEEADDHIVIALSDANLERYGVTPTELSAAMLGTAAAKGADAGGGGTVQVYLIFLASLVDEAEAWIERLPPGRAFACYNKAELPSIVRRILTSTVPRL